MSIPRLGYWGEIVLYGFVAGICASIVDVYIVSDPAQATNNLMGIVGGSLVYWRHKKSDPSDTAWDKFANWLICIVFVMVLAAIVSGFGKGILERYWSD